MKCCWIYMRLIEKVTELRKPIKHEADEGDCGIAQERKINATGFPLALVELIHSLIVPDTIPGSLPSSGLSYYISVSIAVYYPNIVVNKQKAGHPLWQK